MCHGPENKVRRQSILYFLTRNVVEAKSKHVQNHSIQTSLQARYGQHFNLLKTKVNRNYTQIFLSYRAVNTTRLGCKNQSDNSV
jgi:hypothetical protein